MKTDGITKLYDSLSLQERGALAFSYALDGDTLEAARITSTVPRRSYTAPAAEYRQAFSTFERVFTLAALQYWPTVAKLLAITSSLPADEAELEPIFQIAVELEARLLALDGALDEIGAEYGFDSDKVREKMGFLNIKPVLNGKPRPELVKEIKTGLVVGGDDS